MRSSSSCPALLFVLAPFALAGACGGRADAPTEIGSPNPPSSATAPPAQDPPPPTGTSQSSTEPDGGLTCSGSLASFCQEWSCPPTWEAANADIDSWCANPIGPLATITVGAAPCDGLLWITRGGLSFGQIFEYDAVTHALVGVYESGDVPGDESCVGVPPPSDCGAGKYIPCPSTVPEAGPPEGVDAGAAN